MSKLTVAEKKWLNKLQKVLNECPFNRLGYSSLATWLL
ncbi:conserved hypothetical protein [Xenorhabdus cabanillasii JM26]|uniref:Uncharacterized protein n=1 Tax=Xenorhabdus cabanillasii JM26 TaxID=1427517 RepID=W1J803_9GAMM|nr:hypothetical protein Xcab_02966 [Xenorhabdus cabanillasii JM26]CDL86854.1 conserved hypothetical protein [Xenorhabdus cabanillasii JM26]